MRGAFRNSESSQKLEGVHKFDEIDAEIDAVLISHGHLDHSSYLSFMKRQIPISCGETTQIILKALGEIRRADLEFDVEGLNSETFRTGKKLTIGDMEVEPIHVDHSLPGAYGFIVHTSNGSIAYTGDFRVQGAKQEMTWDFVEKAKEANPKAIITEATNMTGATVSSESEVESRLNEIVGQTSGAVLADVRMLMSIG